MKKNDYKSMLKLPPGLWQLAARPYFDMGMKYSKGNLPWGSRHSIKETEDKHNVFEDCGFEIGPVLGHGSFSTVVMAFWIPFKQNVAVKIYTKRKDVGTKSILKLLPTEIEMLKTLTHPNIVSFYGAVETKLRVYLVMELLGCGNLLEYLLKNDSATEAQAKIWFSQLVSGIKYAHDLEVAHRDIKLENILLDMRQNVRISDFGFASPNQSWSEEIPNSGWPKVREVRGSTGYMAPELIIGEPYNPVLADVWAMGIVLYCILFGKFPLGKVNAETIKHMLENFHIPEDPDTAISLVTEECSTVFKSIFKTENERIRSIDLLKCPWLSERKIEIQIGRRAAMKVIDAIADEEREQRITQKQLELDAYNARGSSSSETSSTGSSDYDDFGLSPQDSKDELLGEVSSANDVRVGEVRKSIDAEAK